MKMKKITCLCLVSIFFSGCSMLGPETTIASTRNMSAHNASFSKIIVNVGIDDLALKKTFENAFIERFKKDNIVAVGASSLIFAGEEYTEKKLKKIIAENGIDSEVDIWPAGLESRERTERGNQVLAALFSMSGGAGIAPGLLAVPGNKVEEPVFKFNIDFWSIISNAAEQYMWTAEATVNAFSDDSLENVARSLASEVVPDLKQKIQFNPIKGYGRKP